MLALIFFWPPNEATEIVPSVLRTVGHGYDVIAIERYESLV